MSLAEPSAPPQSAPPSRVATAVGTVAGVALGAILLVAAWGKALDPAAFADQIRLEGLAIVLSPMAMALVALALEVAVGVALLLGVRRLPVLAGATGLVLLFLFLTGRNYWRSVHGTLDPALASCGCFGNLVERSPAEAFWQDALMLAPALLLAFLGRPRGPWPRVRTAAVAVATLAVVAFAWKAPELPVDDLATRLRPGVRASELCVGSGHERVCLDAVVPDLAKGRHLVVIADLDDADAARWVEPLNAWVDAHPERPVTVLATADDARQRQFFWENAPAFTIHQAPAPLLRPLYRRLPRSFELLDGRVAATWPGLPDSGKPGESAAAGGR